MMSPLQLLGLIFGVNFILLVIAIILEERENKRG